MCKTPQAKKQILATGSPGKHTEFSRDMGRTLTACATILLWQAKLMTFLHREETQPGSGPRVHQSG